MNRRKFESIILTGGLLLGGCQTNTLPATTPNNESVTTPDDPEVNELLSLSSQLDHPTPVQQRISEIGQALRTQLGLGGNNIIFKGITGAEYKCHAKGHGTPSIDEPERVIWWASKNTQNKCNELLMRFLEVQYDLATHQGPERLDR